MTLAQSQALRAISFPPNYADSINQDQRTFSETVRRIDSNSEIPSFLQVTQRGAFELLQPFLGSRRDLLILEIGSGYGLGLCALLCNGFNVHGVEPGSTLGFEGRHHRAQALLEHNGCDPERLAAGFGEALPFPDAHFDLVFSIAVLEHVEDPHQVMREALRVCKPGGLVVMNVPNYNSFWEGHYNIVWLPYALSSHRMASRYLRWRHRRPDFAEELNFTTPTQFNRSSQWADVAESVQIYPFLFRPLLYVSAFSYFAGIGAWDQHRILRAMAPGTAWTWLGRGATILARAVTSFGTLLGLAPVFNVVVRKRTK